MSKYLATGQYDDVAIVAPGWSLTREQCVAVRDAGVYSIVIGGAITLFPEASILYHADIRWWENIKPVFDGVRVTMGHSPTARYDADRLGLYHLLSSPKLRGFDLEPGQVVLGNNSGSQAMNMAIHHGPRRVHLLGFDLCVDPRPGPNQGKQHFDGNHPENTHNRSPYDMFIDYFKSMTPYLADLKVSVYNYTQTSALECFPKVDLTCLTKGA